MKNDLWEAKPHTLAKISILRTYLSSWFGIIGSKFRHDLWYVDGFAGPGEYTNSTTGSPVAAISAASDALQGLGSRWKAGKIHCVFIEQDSNNFTRLKNKLVTSADNPKIQTHFLNLSFVGGLSALRNQTPNPFLPPSPLFAFIDPFGAKGVPFSDVKNLLSRKTSEILINLDSDGIGRIFYAGEDANHEVILNEVFGDDSWKAELAKHRPSHEMYRGVLDLYKQKLRDLPNVRYVFAFEMRSAKNTIDYHLVFASQHPLGLEKMKEAMKTIAKNGDYCFSDAHLNQSTMFRFDEPSAYSTQLFEQFRGRTAKYPELRDYALNESPFTNPKSMLKDLEGKGMIQVSSSDPKRRKGTFKEESLIGITFQ
ncbi:MAG: three-Cys-motif partner protein TcmP [Candidatus Nitrotoga sp.]